jgi:hypothetical protein
MSVSGGDPVGFTIGMMIGFAWIVWSGPHRGRGAGTGMYLFMLLCGVIGWGVELAFQWSAGTACHQARGLAMPVPIPAIGAVAGFFGAFVVQVRGVAFYSVSAGARTRWSVARARSCVRHASKYQGRDRASAFYPVRSVGHRSLAVLADGDFEEYVQVLH